MACCLPATGASTSTRQGQVIPLAGAQSVSIGAGQVWVTTLRSLVRIDPERRTVVARTRFPDLVASAVVDGKLVWVLTSSSSGGRGLLYSVDIASGRIVGAPVRLFPMAQGQVIIAGGSLWVTNDNHGRFGRLFRVDPSSRMVVAAVRIPDDPHSVVYAGGSIWVGQSDSGSVVRVDPQTGALQGRPIDVGGALLALAADRGTVWVANTFSGRLAAIDVATARVRSDRPLAGLGGVSASHGHVWTFFFRTGEVAAVTGNQTSTSRVPGGADGIAASGRSLWVVNPLGVTLLDP